MTRRVISWQIVSPDAARSAKFYEQMFGWKVNQANPHGYRELRTGTAGPQGGVWPGPPEMGRPFVQFFVDVDDVESAVKRAVVLGATLLVPRSVLPDGGEMAVLHDPLGMPFVVCSGLPAGSA